MNYRENLNGEPLRCRTRVSPLQQLCQKRNEAVSQQVSLHLRFQYRFSLGLLDFFIVFRFILRFITNPSWIAFGYFLLTVLIYRSISDKAIKVLGI